MTGTTFLRFIAETVVVLLIGYAIYHEADIIKWEDRVFKKLKRFFRNVKKLGFNGVTEIIKEEYENDRNKRSK